MGQSAVVFTAFRTKGGSVVGVANSQGQPLASLKPGNTFYVNETTGLDTNSGNAQYPLKTLAAALLKCTADNGDTIFLYGTVHTTATTAWNVNGVNLVGLNGPGVNPRARISQTGSTVFSPLVDVIAQRCQFIDIGTFHGFADASAQICWKDEGGRNYYQGCALQGGGDATAAAQAGMRSLLISGNTGENEFVNCNLGLDTIVRATAANATLEITGGSPRNKFKGCTFRALCTLNTDVHVLIGADGIDRYVDFDDCLFFNAVDSTGTALNAAISANASAGGSVLVRPTCMSVGATAIATGGPVYVGGAVPAATTSNIGIHAT